MAQRVRSKKDRTTAKGTAIKNSGKEGGGNNKKQKKRRRRGNGK